jgi:hypothetical protein
MSDGFRALRDRMREDVVSRHGPAYSGGRARWPVLVGYATPRDVLHALADERPERYPEREALTRTLLAEHRQRTATLWSSMLVVAYYPMLSRLRYRAAGSGIHRDDLDQLVLTAFLTAIDEIPFEEKRDRIALRLRQRTQRILFGLVRRERNTDLLVSEVDEMLQEHADPRPSPAEECEAFDGANALLERVERLCRSEFLPTALDVIVATVVHEEQLQHYVERVVPGDDVQRRRAYERLKRQRTRLICRLHHVPPATNAAATCS